MPAVAEVFLVDANGDEIGWAGDPAPPPPPPPPPPSSQRFPGDPNPMVTGRTYFGEAHGTNGSVATHETASGTKLSIHRRFYNTSAQIVPPGGAFFAAVREDHANDRLPCVSFKVNWAQGRSGALDSTFDALIAELQSYSKPTWVIINHEPENDGGVAADFRGMQLRFRQRIQAWETAHPTAPRRVAFGGCMMYYTWNPTSGRNPDDWWPGSTGGRLVWDFLGNDHYTEPNQEVNRTNSWVYFANYCNGKGIPYNLPEWGLRSPTEDPSGPTKMKNFWNLMLDGAHDCVGLMYFDSDANSTASGWSMEGTLLAQFNTIMKDPRVLHLSDLGY
jgi:hypothetical protein